MLIAVADTFWQYLPGILAAIFSGASMLIGAWNNNKLGVVHAAVNDMGAANKDNAATPAAPAVGPSP